MSRERDVWELYDRERQENDELREQLAEAQNALLKYGGHAGGCSFNGPYSIGEAHECDCGWKEIKRAAETGGDRE